jgi:NAD(P)-dependent dehydrogenase (short-subunit alcohol dehydrogenase family)
MTPSKQPTPVALVMGAGDSTGGAIARRFAAGGLVGCVTRRDAAKREPLIAAIQAAGGAAHGFASDARNEDEVVALVDRIERGVGPIEVLVFNIGTNVPCSILEETARKYFKIWEMACFGAFAGAKHALRALRALAQSMARELGPQNIHVAHAVVDGAIDTEFIRSSFPDKYATKADDGILNPDHIAENYWHLHRQPRDAWTFELDLRPWNERW